MLAYSKNSLHLCKNTDEELLFDALKNIQHASEKQLQLKSSVLTQGNNLSGCNLDNLEDVRSHPLCHLYALLSLHAIAVLSLHPPVCRTAHPH